MQRRDSAPPARARIARPPHPWCARLVAALALVVLGAWGTPALGEEDAEPGVARLALGEGEVSYLDADAEEWAPVDVNAPLVTGDRLYTGPDARAEVQLPGGVDARLAAETEIELLEVSSRATHVRVGTGTATFRVRDVPVDRHVELSTPSTALVARSRGTYRVDVDGEGRTTVLVREGELDAYRDDDRYRLASGRGAQFVPAVYEEEAPYDGEPIEVFDASAVPYEPFDEWEEERARQVASAASLEYVSDDVYGVAELDRYGAWHRHETYGPIWRPTQVAAGWAPYTTGRWVWQDPWGWTWVDYAPWGWAPAHHGRWVYVQDAWAWAPGPVVRQPVYAPATVGFLGVRVGTPSVSVSVGFNVGPSVGWVPLGWGEPIIPWWRGVGGARYGEPWWGGWGGPRVVNNTVIKNVNVTNVDVTNIRYAHFDRPRALTAVHRDAFLAGRVDRLDVPERELRRLVRPLRGAPEVVPRRESLLAARPTKLREAKVRRPDADLLRRAAITTRAVPDARPAFDARQRIIERAKGAPVAPDELRRLARETRATGRETKPAVRTVQARGKRPVTPDITAPAPARPGVAVQRTRRDALPTGAREARSAPATRDVRQASERAREERSAGRTLPGARAERGRNSVRDAEPASRTRAPREESAVARQPATPRTPRREAVAREQRAAEQPAQREAVARQRRDAEQRTQREAVARQQRDAEQRAQRESVARQRREAEQRTQRESVARQRRDAEQRAQRESVARQRRDAEQRAQRESVARQRRETEQRAQRESVARQRRETEQRAQREAVTRQRRDAEQRAQRESVARQRREAPRRAESTRRAPAERDEREAARRAPAESGRGRRLPGA